MIPNPWVIVGILVIWAASCAGAYYKGGEHREAAIIAAAAKTAQEAQDKATAAAKALEAKKGRRRALDRDIDEGVTAYAATDSARFDCADPEFMRLFQGIAAGDVSGGGSGPVSDKPAAP